ncbi:hypothetical protein LINGRAHAP2_LOCUS14131 [Linum grandiflorum]
MARLDNFFRVNVFPGSQIDDSAGLFEFDESDILWSGCCDSASKYRTSSKAAANRRSPATRFRSAGTVSTSASLPVNIPDWSKIYKEDCYGERGRRAEMSLSELAEDSDYDEEWSGGGGGDWEEERVPPHEYLARRRGASLSVNETAGRTLKVRNAIWKKVGFED